MIMKGHRPFRADVRSCRSVLFLNSVRYLDGKLIEREEPGMQPSFGKMQVPERSLSRSRWPVQMLNAARIDAGIERGAWQTNGAAR